MAGGVPRRHRRAAPRAARRDVVDAAPGVGARAHPRAAHGGRRPHGPAGLRGRRAARPRHPRLPPVGQPTPAAAAALRDARGLRRGAPGARDVHRAGGPRVLRRARAAEDPSVGAARRAVGPAGAASAAQDAALRRVPEPPRHGDDGARRDRAPHPPRGARGLPPGPRRRDARAHALVARERRGGPPAHPRGAHGGPCGACFGGAPRVRR